MKISSTLLMDTVVNRELPSLHVGSLEISPKTPNFLFGYYRNTFVKTNEQSKDFES